MEHTPETLAYAAGLLDAEGHIEISVRHVKEGGFITHPHHEMFACIKITEFHVIEWLNCNFHGCIANSWQQPSRLGNRPAWTWRIAGPMAQHFLEQVLPYLRIKHQQASIAVAFQLYRRDHRRTRWTSEQETQETLAQNEIYRHQINSLHLSRKVWNSNGVIAQAHYAIPSSDLPEVRAYCAGFFEGEGCVHIRAIRPTEERGNGKLSRPSYRLTVELANTDRPIIEWLRDTFGGTFQDRSHTPSIVANPRRRAVFMWYKPAGDAQKFLMMLLPYLKIKQKQAELAIAFQSANQPHASKTPVAIAVKESYWAQIRQLNYSISKPIDALTE